MYKISVIVPVYNAEKYLEKCLDSLINQTLSEIEIILVNDGSKDNSQEIIEKYLSKYPEKIKSYIKENGGQASARNLGIKEATGDFIAFVDSDDWIELDMYEKLYNKANNDNLDIVCCNTYLVINGEKIKNEPVKLITDDITKKYILLESGPCNKIFKREIIQSNNIRFFENHIYEDLATIPTFALYTKKIAYIDSYLYNYLIREGSTMNQVIYNKKLEDIFDSMKELSDKFKENYIEELEYLYIEHLLHAASLRFLNYQEGKIQRNRINKIMKDRFPNWKYNKYFKQRDFKYRLMCKLLYKNGIGLKLYLKIKK